MTPAASSGTVSLYLQTYDAAPTNVAFAIQVTGITTSMDEIAIAYQFHSQMACAIYLNNCTYMGTPAFSCEPYQAQFQVTRTENSVCLWSQARFRLYTTADTTGGIYRLAPNPLLLTVAEARRKGAIGGVCWVNWYDNSAFSSSEISDAIEEASAELIGYLQNNIVISTYLFEMRGKQVSRVFTRPLPGIYNDPPIIRRKNLYEVYSIPQYSALAYNWVRSTGELEFRFAQTYINAGEPFALDNEIRMTFIAGETFIPNAIKKAVVQLAGIAMLGRAGIESFGGATFKMTLREHEKELARIFRPVREYRMTPRSF